MSAITLENINSRISNSMSDIADFKNKAYVQNKTSAIVKKFRALNKEMNKLDFDGITSAEAKSKLEIIEKLHHKFSSFLNSFIDKKNHHTIDEQLFQEMSKTLQHLEEILEALEIHADEEAMRTLSNYLNK